MSDLLEIVVTLKHRSGDASVRYAIGFDAWEPVPLPAIEAYSVAVAEAQARAQTDGDVSSLGTMNRAFVELFDASAKTATRDGKGIEVADVPWTAKSAAAMRVLREVEVQGNEHGQPSSGTSPSNEDGEDGSAPESPTASTSDRPGPVLAAPSRA